MARKVYSQEEIERRMDALPEAAADFLYSSEMNGIIKSIADKHALHIDQMGLLGAEAGQLILGLTEPQDFAPYIAESLNIGADKAATIAKDVNDQLMSKIRASMGHPSSAGPESKPSAPSFAPSTPMPAAASPSPSVVMPSSVASAAPAAGAPTPPAGTPPFAQSASATQAPTPAPAPRSPAPAPNLGAADAILTEKKVTPPAPAPASAPSAPAPVAHAAAPAPKPDPAQPKPYTADPYREPVE